MLWNKLSFFCFLSFSTISLSEVLSQSESSRAEGSKPIDTKLPEFRLDDLSSEDGITADEAVKRAIETAPSMNKVKAAVAASEAVVNQALVAAFPKLDLSGRYTRLSDIDNPSLGGGDALTDEQAQMLRDSVNQVMDPAAQSILRGSVEQQIGFSSLQFPVILDQWALKATLSYPVSDLFFAVLPAYRAAQHAAESRQFEVESKAMNIALRTREAYYGFLRAKVGVMVTEANVKQAESQMKKIENLVVAGMAASVDQMRMQARLASSKVGFAQATGGLRVASKAFRMLLHQKGDGELGIRESIEKDVEVPEMTIEQMIDKAIVDRPEIRMLTEVATSQDYLASARRGGYLPHLVLQGNVDYANPNNRIFPQETKWTATWDVNVVLSWSPNDSADGSFKVDEAKAGVLQVEADLAELKDGVRLEVEQAWQSLLTARAAIDAAKVGQKAAEEGYRIRNLQLEQGKAVLSDLIDSETELTTARIQLANAYIDRKLAHVRLLCAMGDSACVFGKDSK